jgi:Zn-dependent protease with chaperone function
MNQIITASPTSNQVEWNGAFFGGDTPSSQSVKICVASEGLHVWTNAGERLWWPYEQFRQTQGFYAGQQIRLETIGTPTQAITISDERFLDAVQSIAGSRGRNFHRRSRRSWRPLFTIVAALTIAGMGFWLYIQGVPSFARLAAQRVPVSWEEQMGKTIVDETVSQHHACVESKRAVFIDQLLEKLTSALPPQPYVFRVSVVDSPVVNAFAAPGGYIVVYKGLLLLTQSSEELAGVLAHEIQHVTHRHVTRLLIQQASMGILFGALTGDLNGVMSLGVQAASLLGGLSYSREAEEEADREAVKLLIAARINPHGMVTFFERLRQKNPEISPSLKYLSTHPLLDERIRVLNIPSPASGNLPDQLMPPVEWVEMADMCYVHSNS